EASEGKISKAIKPGGLHRVKAKRIKEASRYIVEKFSGNLSAVLTLPKEEARKTLKQIPGVGDKTADVLLTSIHGYRETLVVDTHMSRIAKRLGLAEDNAKYEDIQESLKEFIPWSEIPKEKWERIVGLLWLLAKHTCKAQRPKCKECPLANLCEKRIGLKGYV
ncbi:MAG: endonuclease III, partial [Candidatus Brockarchaeota archaeon]|nr:endonuclease III [Candidatus Brockarchaeota archaeon]